MSWGLGTEVSRQLKAAGHQVMQVSAGARYERIGAGTYVICPGVRGEYDRLFAISQI